MLTGIIGAMQVEIDALKKMITDPVVEEISGVEMVRGTLGGQEAVVAQCGLGKVFAALCAQTMILRYGVDRVINIGVAGTLSPKLGLLDIAVSDGLVQHDMDTSPLGDPVGMISGINIVRIPASQTLANDLTEAAERLGLRAYRGVIASGDQFIADEGKKTYIRDTFDAVACEMEGAAIGQVCFVNGVDFVVLRCISDNASSEAGQMEYPELCRRAAEQSQKLLLEFLK